MKEVLIYHNNRCSKSRQALQVLQEKEITLSVINYMQDVITVKELTEVLTKLNIKPDALLRKSEGDYKEHVKGRGLSDQELVKLMVEYPKLIERPIVIAGEQAVIARPVELIETLFKTTDQ
tara:strand:- start:3617 stop:3979 length:363 start_codon:yes stop_codon:yes gene_type:complete